MHSEGHVGLGMLLYAPVAFILMYLDMAPVMALGLVGAIFFSYAPDFDLWLPYVTHRGATHTILGGIVGSIGAAIIGIVFAIRGYLDVNATPLMLIGIGAFTFAVSFVGFLSHLVGDIITPMGIQPLRPWSDWEHSFEIVYASDQEANEQLGFIGAVALTIAIAGGHMLQNNTLSAIL